MASAPVVGKKRTNKRKKKEDDYITRLEKEIRELKSINRSLMKRLKKLDRNFKKVEDLEEELIEIYKNEEHKPKVQKCPECAKGTIIETNLGVRILKKCSESCGWRQTVKS